MNVDVRGLVAWHSATDDGRTASAFLGRAAEPLNLREKAPTLHRGRPMDGEWCISGPAARNRSSSTPKPAACGRRGGGPRCDECADPCYCLGARTFVCKELVNKFGLGGMERRRAGWLICQPAAQNAVRWVFTILTPLFNIIEHSPKKLCRVPALRPQLFLCSEQRERRSSADRDTFEKAWAPVIQSFKGHQLQEHCTNRGVSLFWPA